MIKAADHLINRQPIQIQAIGYDKPCFRQVLAKSFFAVCIVLNFEQPATHQQDRRLEPAPSVRILAPLTVGHAADNR
jgi:hypothetical protein